MNDLLNDPLIGASTTHGDDRLSLPEVLAGLSAGDVEGYTGLRAHQADPWHVFLVQLAASIQARRPTPKLPVDAAYWREGLLDLSEGKGSAWHLLVDDVTQPAFLQHPWKGWDDEAKDYGVKTSRGKPVFDPKASTPDELDVLVTAKNHDVKMSRLSPTEEEAWLFALLLYQTTSGFLGAGNYGIVRMNGGFASRPIVAWASSLHPTRRFNDEVRMLCGLRDTTRAQYGYQAHGVVLTWLTRWNRSTHQYALTDLEPWFVEAARPARLWRSEEGLMALGATSKARQIGPKTLDSGDVGDPWIPINVQDKKKGRSALTISSNGFAPERLTDLLFEQGFELTPLQKPQPGEGTGWFVASALARGQGTTEGFHRIELPVPPKAHRALLRKESRETLAHLAQDLLTDAKDVARALGMALTLLSEGGPEKADFDRDAVKRWVEKYRMAFARDWEARYFPTLWRGADEEHATVRADWQQAQVDAAQALLNQAVMRLPLPANRYWRAVIQSESAFRGMLRKQGMPLPQIVSGEFTEPPEEVKA